MMNAEAIKLNHPPQIDTIIEYEGYGRSHHVVVDAERREYDEGAGCLAGHSYWIATVRQPTQDELDEYIHNQYRMRVCRHALMIAQNGDSDFADDDLAGDAIHRTVDYDGSIASQVVYDGGYVYHLDTCTMDGWRGQDTQNVCYEGLRYWASRAEAPGWMKVELDGGDMPSVVPAEVSE